MSSLLALTLTINVGAVVAFVISFAAFAAAVGVISRLRPVKWLWNTVVVKPATAWLESVVGRVVDEKLDARPILNGKGRELMEKVLDDSVS